MTFRPIIEQHYSLVRLSFHICQHLSHREALGLDWLWESVVPVWGHCHSAGRTTSTKLTLTLKNSPKLYFRLFTSARLCLLHPGSIWSVILELTYICLEAENDRPLWRCQDCNSVNKSKFPLVWYPLISCQLRDSANILFVLRRRKQWFIKRNPVRSSG